MEQLSRWEKFFLAVFGKPERLVDYPFLLKEDREGRTQGWAVCQALKTLTSRERKVVIRRFGLNGQEPKTLKVIGKEFGVRGSRIGQIMTKALRKCQYLEGRRILETFLYKPTALDQRVILAREELAEILKSCCSPEIAFAVAESIKRDCLRPAFRSLQKGEKREAASVLAISCQVEVSRCLHCQTLIIPGQTFCSKGCRKAYYSITLVCDGCGQEFIRAGKKYRRSEKSGYRHAFCNRQCQGRWLGRTYGKGRKKTSEM